MNTFFDTESAKTLGFKMFSLPHILPLLLIIIFTYFIILKKHNIKQHQQRTKFILAIILLSQQTLLYTWYCLGKENILIDSLPLYICRIVTICIVISFLFNTRKLYFIIYYFGSIGSLIALIMPDTSGYLFPHVMYVQFFITHGVMLISVMYIRYIEGYEPSLKELRKVIVFIFGYAIVTSQLNKMIGSNYGYLERPPASNNLFDFIPHGLIYKLVVIGIVILLPCLFHYIVRELPVILKSYSQTLKKTRNI